MSKLTLREQIYEVLRSDHDWPMPSRHSGDILTDKIMDLIQETCLKVIGKDNKQKYKDVWGEDDYPEYLKGQNELREEQRVRLAQELSE